MKELTKISVPATLIKGYETAVIKVGEKAKQFSFAAPTSLQERNALYTKMRELKAEIKALADARLALTSPYDKVKAAIIEHERETREQLEKLVVEVERAIIVYDKNVKDELQRQADARRKQIEEDRKAERERAAMASREDPFATPATIPEALPAVPTEVLVPVGKGTRKTIEIEAIDLNLLPDRYKIIRADEAKIKAAILDGVEIPGVKANITTKVV